MVTTMDRAGRIVLPKAARERAGLVAGMPLEVRVVDGRVEIEPVAARVTVEKKSGIWVATPVEKPPVLRQADVDRSIDELRAPSDLSEPV